MNGSVPGGGGGGGGVGGACVGGLTEQLPFISDTSSIAISPR